MSFQPHEGMKKYQIYFYNPQNQCEVISVNVDEIYDIEITKCDGVMCNLTIHSGINFTGKDLVGYRIDDLPRGLVYSLQ